MPLLNLIGGSTTTLQLPYGPVSSGPRDPAARHLYIADPYPTPEEGNFWNDVYGPQTIAVWPDTFSAQSPLYRRSYGVDESGEAGTPSRLLYDRAFGIGRVRGLGGTDWGAGITTNEQKLAELTAKPARDRTEQDKKDIAELRRARTIYYGDKSRDWFSSLPTVAQVALALGGVLLVTRILSAFGKG